MIYVELLRGKYNINDVEFYNIIDEMTLEEKKNLIKNEFEEGVME